ncbi:MAG TPA: SET domain-containing protein-lysine N-methyltransferase [Longimicrobiales bacterium]
MATKQSSNGAAPGGRAIKMIQSKIHGRGVIATRDIAAGEKIVEYVGEIITPGEADRRYPFEEDKPHHTFLFSVNSRKIIDAAHGGNIARWINHSCDPNCEALVEKGRVFIYALRDIKKGEELVYDYWFVLDEPHTRKMKAIYPCRCGSKNCRGTILADKRKARAYLGVK